MTLIERDDSLAVLERAFNAARTTGQLVSLSGEAGIGKSALLRAFAARAAPAARVLWGYCEPLSTPRPLGPLLDIAPALAGRTTAALAAGSTRHDVFAAFVEDLAHPGSPIVAMFEDIHWADAATFDLLQYVGRRIRNTRAVVAVSWRDDEVSPDHSIHRVLGDWRHPVTHRIQLRPLSLAAVEQLADGARNARTLHALTGGNPFFVTEMLSEAADVVPASVREAVLARRARLEAPARAVLDLVSVVPLRAEFTLISAALGPAVSDLDACLTAGLLCADAQAISFRHELARLAVVEALPLPRVQDCHRRVLNALVARPDRAQALARIVHHAEACGDLEALLEHAPAAARQAAAVGAHKQAVDHYQRALRCAGRLSPESRAALTEALAYEHYLIGDIDTAREARHAALGLWRQLAVPLAIGRNVRCLSRLAWFAGDREEAQRRADEAIAVLGELPEGEDLAMAFSNRSQLDMLSNHLAPCIAWGTKAVNLARSLGSDDVLCHALNNVGTMRMVAGEVEGREQIEASLRLALAGDFHEHTARAYANLSSIAVTARDYAEAARWLDSGIQYCTERDLDSWNLYMLAYRARMRADTCLWQGACEDAETVIAAPMASTVSRIPALAALGLVRVRRGDPGAARPLREALELARRTGEAQRLVPVLLAKAELAWFTGRHAAVEDAAREGLAALAGNDRVFGREALWYWLWKVNGARIQDVEGQGPYAQLIRGNWQGAADRWRDLGGPYECALALIEGDLAAVRQAVDILHSLGAAPAAGWARQRLRQMGVVRVPRGRRPGTRSHPAGLTARESEILDLLALGLRNPQIAHRLFVSPKTVEHHVSAILAKLAVTTRDAAVAHGRQQGWLRDRR